MPKNTKKSSAGPTAQLARLPRDPELVIEGGKRNMPVYVRQDRQTFQPQLVLWVDSHTGFVRAAAPVNPLQTKDNGLSEAITGLTQALLGPFISLPTIPTDSGADSGARNPLQARPALPARILTDDPELAEAARQLLASLNVPVILTEQIPVFEEAFNSMSEMMGADETADPPEDFSWELDPNLLSPLFQSLAAYVKAAAWKYMPDTPPVAINLGPQFGPDSQTETIYASIMGNGGILKGIAFYYDLEDYINTVFEGEANLEEEAAQDEELEEAIEQLRRAGAPVDQIPISELRTLVTNMLDQDEDEDEQAQKILDTMGDCITLYLELPSEVEPTYLEWLEDHGLKFTARQLVPTFHRIERGYPEPRLPNDQEVKSLILTIEALNQFFNQHGRFLKKGILPDELKYTAQVTPPGATKATPIEITFPPTGFMEEFEFEE